MNKTSLRLQAKEQAKKLDKTTWEKNNQFINARLKNNPWVLSAKNIFIYLPKFPEPDISPLFTDWIKTKNLITWDGENLVFLNNLNFKKGIYNLFIPAEKNLKKAKKEDINLALIPGVLFDKNNYRLGHGGGFFDKLLENRKFKTIGIAQSWQIKENLPTEKHDQKVDLIITEN